MLQKQKLFYLNLKASNLTWTSNSNYLESNYIPLLMLATLVVWLTINLTGILILIMLFQNIWEVTQCHVNKDNTLQFYIPILCYHSMVTTRLPPEHMTVLQKKASRNMGFAPYNFHSLSYFHDCNILKFCDIVKPVLSLTVVLMVTLFQYLLKDLNLYQNLMFTTLDHPIKAYFLF